MAVRIGVSLALTVPLLLGGAQAALSQTPEEALVAPVKNGPLHKLGAWLANLSDEYQRASNKKAFKTRNPALRVSGNKVGIDLYASDAISLRSSLAALGATHIKAKGPLISAQVPLGALPKLAALESLKFASPALAATDVASQGSVVSQGDRSLNSDTVRENTGLDGTGVTVGVMSDTFRCNPAAFVPGAPAPTAAQDAATQDVPPDIEVLDNGPCGGAIDEGRGMSQLVKDVAPGASQKFHTAFNSLVDFADGILELEEAGSDIIVDDVIYFAENMFSDGIVAQAADEAVERGAAYFSSAGNRARLSYEAPYRETIVQFGRPGDPKLFVRAHDFGGGDTLQKIEVTQDGGQGFIIFSLQWDQPFLSSTTYAHETDPTSTSAPRGATTDLDMLIYDENFKLVKLCPPGVATGITCQITGDRNIGGDAVDLAAVVSTGPKTKTGTFYIRIVRAGGEVPRNIKYVAFESAGLLDIVEHDNEAPAAYGHTNSRGAEAVGASSWYLTEEFDAYFSDLVQDTPGACIPACLNAFSSAGGTPIYLNKYGERLAVPEVRETPGVTGPDGGNTTFFIGDSSFDDDDGDGCNSPTSVFITPCLDNPAHEKPNFFGTSASAPHVAGVAALMLQKNGGLTPQQVYDILRDTAEDMTKREVAVVPGPGNSQFSALPAGYDFDSGHGFVDAVAALAATPAAAD
jgi:subtilisin family serine protease